MNGSILERIDSAASNAFQELHGGITWTRMAGRSGSTTTSGEVHHASTSFMFLRSVVY
ncbi:hypothetical protein DEV91_102405 [Phyllobacterium brassicacearum]|nr:hypothetical protein DEV91_102405 [Phyllobacterium brassicacearum]